ncbi:MAG: hypothetical protein EU547_00750 [Promethearchaeota archaeon]|nr:MAG: hypothetical protein EU547_00750 [Candidatus Lokiarchaeota archaeon]
MSLFRIKVKLLLLKDKVKDALIEFKNKYIVRDIYIKGKKEPPKSYAFQKKFLGLYSIFIIYSFLLIWGINDPNNLLITFITIGQPFVIGSAIVAFYLTLSLIININKLRDFLFGSYTIIKQILLYGGIITGYFFLFLFTYTWINYMSVFLALSLIWLGLLSSRYYIYSRKFSTKIEARLVKKYSIQRYIGALIAPFVIIVLLVMIAYFYRSFLVWITLDIFSLFNPVKALSIYNAEMDIVMPFIYFSLVMTFVFIILEYFSTRRKAETKRVGTFDNLTFSLIIMFIFFFQLFQMTIFLLLMPETTTMIREAFGAGGSAVSSVIFIFEFIISTIILYRIIIRLGKSYGWELLFFKRDGLILFFLGSIMAQSLTRYTLSNDIVNQSITAVGNILMADKYIISIIMIVFLGVTLLYYYIKPRQTSMFMSSAKFIVSKEDKSMDNVYKVLKREYVKRGEPYPLEILERELIKTTRLSKSILYSLITRLADKELDLRLVKKWDEEGHKVYWVEFLSITGSRYEKKSVSEKKAKKFLAEQLIESTSRKKQNGLKRISKGVKSSEAPDQLLSSLSTRYDQKQAEQKKQSEINKNKEFTFKPEKITEDLIRVLIEIIEEEYNARIVDIKKYPELYPTISEIVKPIQERTNITAGDVYPILNEINKTRSIIKLVRNPELPEDKKIWIRDLADFSTCYKLEQFRPNEYLKLKKILFTKFCESLQQKYPKSIMNKLYRDLAKQKEKSGATRRWKENLNYFKNHISEYHSYVLQRPKLEELRQHIRKLTKKK